MRASSSKLSQSLSPLGAFLLSTSMVGVGVIVGAPSNAAASTVLAVPEPALTLQADTIAFGTLIDTRTQVTKEGAVITTARFQVYRAVRGTETGAIFTMMMPGGRLPNGLIAHTAGAPLLEGGQMWLGFFESWADGTKRPLGLSYGLLRVRSDGRGGFRVFRDIEGLGLIGVNGEAVKPEVYTLADQPLDVVIARLQRHLAAVGSGSTPPVVPGGASTHPTAPGAGK